MTPNDFGLSMIEQAYRKRASAHAVSRGVPLDERAAYWLVPIEHQPRLYSELEAQRSLIFDQSTRRATLYGLPIRFTVGDPPETPEIQLVMEPESYVAARMG
jgi:hypothetical protein